METTELESAPSLASLYARAVSTSLIPGGGDDLPERALVLRDVELAPERAAAYARVCGFGIRDTVPGTYPHVLAFPLQMKLMTDRSFPFSVLGLVHIANRVEVLAPLQLGSRLDFSLRAEDLRPHRRGRQFDMVVEAQLGGEPAWRGRSTYLRRGKDGAADSDSRDPEPPDDISGLATSAIWRVPGDIGRRYGRSPMHAGAVEIPIGRSKKRPEGVCSQWA